MLWFAFKIAVLGMSIAAPGFQTYFYRGISYKYIFTGCSQTFKNRIIAGICEPFSSWDRKHASLPFTLIGLGSCSTVSTAYVDISRRTDLWIYIICMIYTLTIKCCLEAHDLHNCMTYAKTHVSSVRPG